MGDDTRVYLGSAELAAVTALEGKLPLPETYFSVLSKRINPYQKEIYKYLQFDEMEKSNLEYERDIIKR
jgi:aconitate hydratase 2/2-methylisocitrate dehydratase